jgi:uncharacterized membrane protein YhfC
MTIQPPPSGARLLKRLVPSENHDALLGDLCEEYQRDRSLLWYRAQILAAIVIGSLRNVRTHWVLSLKAMALGAATFLAYFQVIGIMVLNNIPYWMQPPLGLFGFFVMAGLFFLAGFAASGWVIVRFHRRYGIALAVPFAALTAALSFADIARILWTLHSSSAEMLFNLLIKPLFAVGVLAGGYAATLRARLA